MVAGGLAVAGVAACSTVTAAAPVDVQPHGAAAVTPSDTTRPGYTPADVQFMQHMIGHHGQALAMTALVPARTTRGDIRTLAQRIEQSQRDEIAMMQRWLASRHEMVPSLEAHHEHHAPQASAAPQPLMPGMLTSDELAQLARARGPEFERLFLTYMIRHHEGALTMVAQLFAARGAGQEPELFRLASDIDADQRAEISRMRSLPDAPSSDGHRR
jgi:uncharacterized protein (DUF305 family)